MLIKLFVVIYYLVAPYWDTLKRSLLNERFSTLTIIHGPNLVGHPIGIIALLIFNFWEIPTDPLFYVYWFCMIAIASASLILNLWGLTKTTFFGAQVLGNLGFVVSSLAAVIVLNESITPLKIGGMCLAVIGTALFAIPPKMESRLKFDTGIIFIIISLLLGAIAAIFYKLAALHTTSYGSFLTGRFLGDAIGWSVVWLVGFLVILRKNPFSELIHCLKKTAGWRLMTGSVIWTLLSSWLIYSLPVSTFVMFGTLTIPVAYLWSRHHYRDVISPRMYLGTFCIVLAIGLFIY